MKRSITRWTMALATAGVLSLPVSSFARTTQDPQPQPQQQQPPAQPQQQPQPEPQPTPTPAPQQPTPTPQPSATAAQPQAEQALTPQDHLKKAQEAANDISASSLPAKNKTALDEMKRHLTNLDKVGSSSAAPSPTETAKKGSEDSKAMNWGTEVAAIDKIIGEMVGSESSTPTAPATPTPTGTSGKSAAIDDATRAKLMEVRAHITAYAAGMAGASTPKTEAAAPKTEAAAPKTEAAATPETPAARPEPATAPAAQNPPAQSPSPSPAQPDPNAAPPAQPPAAQQPTAQQPTPAAQAPAAQAQPQVDTDAAHKYLVTARETLAQLTQLPAAAQLAGEARNQVSQLITNFNELITTQANWKASYDKVNANLTALIGPDNSDAEANAGAAAAPNAPPTATPGAVGTAGTTTIEVDPAIRAKLVELRKNLNEFRKAAGGGQ